MVLLCTHWGCCPGDHRQQGLHSCFHPDAGSCLVGEARPSGRLVGGFISTRPPCCGFLLPLQSSQRGTTQLPNHPRRRGELGFGHCFLLAATWLCKSSRSEATKSLWGYRLLLPVCTPLPCLPRWCQRAALAQPVVLRWGLILLNVDTATPTPELSRHPYQQAKSEGCV